MDDTGVFLRRILRVLVTLALAFGARAYADGPEGKVNFNLASDEFPKAILEFCHQSKIEVLFLAKDEATGTL
jgi:hypothetical protein